MKKITTTEITICDFEHAEETLAVGKVQPSGKDACPMHLNAFTEEIRLPVEFGSDMSGYKIAVDPGFNAKMKVVYKEEA